MYKESTMKNFRNAIVVLLLLFIVGCSSTTDSSTPSEDALKSLMQAYPTVQTNFDKLPDDFQDKVIMPRMDTIPFAVESVSVFTTAGGLLPPGVKTTFDVAYKAENNFPRINITAFDIEGQKVSLGKNAKKVILKNEIEGYYNENEINWVSKDKRVHYLVKFVKGPDREGSITKKEAIKIANSMVKQT